MNSNAFDIVNDNRPIQNSSDFHALDLYKVLYNRIIRRILMFYHFKLFDESFNWNDIKEFMGFFKLEDPFIYKGFVIRPNVEVHELTDTVNSNRYKGSLIWDKAFKDIIENMSWPANEHNLSRLNFFVAINKHDYLYEQTEYYCLTYPYCKVDSDNYKDWQTYKNNVLKNLKLWTL